MPVWLAVLATAIAGIAGALQARMLGNVFTKVGLLANTLITFIVGLAIILIIVVIASLVQYQHPWKLISEIKFSSLKPWEATAGMFSIIIVTGLGLATSRMGVTSTLVVLLITQITVGVIIDYFGLFGGQTFAFTPLKIVSIILMCMGVYLFFRT